MYIHEGACLGSYNLVNNPPPNTLGARQENPGCLLIMHKSY